jgi:protein-disulfide isomerase
MRNSRRSPLKKSTKVSIAVTAGVALILILVVTLAVIRPWETPSVDAQSTEVLEDNTHLLDDAGPDAPVIVEFLDFECEACGAMYPVVEQLRLDYAGEVTFANRYFPIPSHFNSMNAALAVEAAAQQGAYEEMYSLMFETQSAWGEQQTSAATLFRSYADRLELDLDEYDASIADPATQERVEFDFEAGQTLGVEGTPTFFLDGEMLELNSVDDLRSALDAALAQ